MPVVCEQVGKVKRKRYPEYGSRGESAHYGAHGPSPSFIGKEIGHDRKHLCTDDAAEEAGKDTGREQESVGGGDTAGQCAQQETGIGKDQGTFPVEPVDKECDGKSRDKCADGVAGHEQAELEGGDLQIRDQVIAQGHHDHEVEDMREVEPGQEE